MAARRRTQAAIEDSTPPVVAAFEKAEVSVTAPGIRFHVLKKDDVDNNTTNQRKITRQQKASVHYEMYRQHPTIRAAVEKRAKVAVSTGYAFAAEPMGGVVNEQRAKALRLFFRKSNAIQLLKLTYLDLLVFGDAFWWIERARNGTPLRAMRLHPAFVDIKTRAGKVSEYVYSSSLDESSDAKRYKPDRVIHFKIDDPASDLYGLSLLESLESVVAVDLFALQYNGKFFENSAQTGTVFALKSTDEGEIQRNREYLNQNYVGTDNAHKPLLLEGDVEVKRSVSSAQEMQFIEGRKMLREEMLEVLDVPHDKLGIIEDANRSTSKESDNTFRSEAIAPMQALVEEGVNNGLILEMFGWDDIVFRHNEVSTRDSLDMMKLLAESERMGVLSIDEIRDKMFGLKGIPGGDKHFVQTAAGLIPVEFLDDIAARMMAPGTDAFGNNPGGWIPPAPAAGASDPQDNFDPSSPSIGDLRGGEGEG